MKLEAFTAILLTSILQVQTDVWSVTTGLIILWIVADVQAESLDVALCNHVNTRDGSFSFETPAHMHMDACAHGLGLLVHWH